MFITYTKNHIGHRQSKEILNWGETPSYEQPKRIENIKNSLLNNYKSLKIYEDLIDFDDKIIFDIHSAGYIHYLMSLEKKIMEWDEFFWNDFWYRYNDCEPESETAKRWYYVADTYTAFTKNIRKIAREGYQTIHTAWLKVIETWEIWFALTRPPWHHAMKSKAHWYCYLSNASIFANFLKNKWMKVWILDIDYHHWNGAQTIFYEEDKIVTVSIHTNPAYNFPYYSWYAHENWVWKWLWKNLNVVLEEGTTDEEYLAGLKIAIDFLEKESIDFLIVPLWFDTYEKDPIWWFNITFDGYKKIWNMIKKIGKKTLFIQEWWYNMEDIWNCAVSFFSSIV